MVGLFFSCSNSMDNTDKGKIVINEAWIRELPHGSNVTAAYMLINNNGNDDRLIGASSNCAEKIEIHNTYVEGDLMRMKMLSNIELKSGNSVKLKPSGYHLMLKGVTCNTSHLEEIPLTLTFEKYGNLSIKAVVRKIKGNILKHHH